jgi:hypothetical protein
MKEIVKEEKNILESISDIYVFLMIILFPLIVDKTGFFHILECKWNSFVTIGSIYIISCLLIVLYYLAFKKVWFFNKRKLSKAEIIAIVF